MQRIMPIIFVLVSLLQAPRTAHADIILLDPAASYLLADSIPGNDAVPISLSSLSFAVNPGDFIRIGVVGTWSPFTGDNTFTWTTGVFSSTSTLLPVNNLNRVPGAIAAGTNYVTLPVFGTDSSTDIQQDFLVSDNPGNQTFVNVQVPMGANYLFVAAMDSLYPDNTSPNGNYGVNITPASVPEPNSFILLGITTAMALCGWKFNRRRMGELNQ